MPTTEILEVLKRLADIRRELDDDTLTSRDRIRRLLVEEERPDLNGGASYHEYTVAGLPVEWYTTEDGYGELSCSVKCTLAYLDYDDGVSGCEGPESWGYHWTDQDNCWRYLGPTEDDAYAALERWLRGHLDDWEATAREQLPDE